MKAFKIFSLAPVIITLIVPLLSPLALFGGLSDEILTKSDAEKIMGEPVKLTEEKREVKDDITKKNVTYTALKNEPESNRTVNLYLSLQEFKDSALAKNAYTNIIESNVRMPGQSLVSGIGDEAWYHSDNENFSLIMVRKNEKLLLIKINKMTKKFSREELQNISKRIVG